MLPVGRRVATGFVSLAIAGIFLAPTLLVSAMSRHEQGADSGKLLEVIEPPPENIPTLTVNDREIEPLSFFWPDTDGSLMERVPSDETTVESLPTVPRSHTASFHVDSSVQPAALNVRFFYSIDATGHPKDTDNRHIECVSDADECSINVNENGISGSFELDTRAVFAVVELLYANLEMEENTPYSTVTFGFNID